MAQADNSDPKRMWGVVEVLQMSWPASASMLNSQLMRFVDGLMVSFTGPDPMAAQMVGSLTAFAPESFATGMLSVVNTFVSQNLGTGRPGECGRYAWAGIFTALAFCVLIAPLAIFAEPIFRLLNQPPELLELEAMYFRYMVLAVFFTLTARPLEQFFYGIGRPRLVLVATLAAQVNHLVWGYILIFGALGFPRLGLRGSAIATVCSWGLHLAILSVLLLSVTMHGKFGTRFWRSATLAHARDLLRVGWPAGLEFLTDVLPWSVMLSVLVGHFGATHIAASTAAMRWMPISFMPAVGIGIATTALVGRYIGEGKPQLARRRTHAAVVVALAYMGVCAAVFFLVRYPMVRLFVTETPSPDMSAAQAAQNAEEIIRIGGWIMVCAAVFQLFDAVGIVFMGALRGAGDTFRPMLYTVFLSWGLVAGGGWLMVQYFPQLTSVGPWIAASLYVIALGVVMAARFERGAWQKITLLRPQDA